MNSTIRKWSWSWTTMTVVACLVAPALGTNVVGIFFDQEGTENEVSYDSQHYLFYAYVLAYAEFEIGGAAFTFDIVSDNTHILFTQYPDGYWIGDPSSGVEIGLASPVPGFGGTFALVATCRLRVDQDETLPVVHLDIHDHPTLGGVLVYNWTLSAWEEAEGLGARLLGPNVLNRASTWGVVKAKFR
jgi:hypothetical protein